MPYTFEYADKAELEAILPRCFELLYNNMNSITPFARSYERELEEWYGEVYPAMRKDPRQIVLMYDDGALAGYFQYYVNAGVFMMEEIQISREHRGSGLFRKLYTWLMGELPDGITTVCAYSHKLNPRSQAILHHLGLSECGEQGDLLEYRGEYAVLREKYE